MKYEGHNFGETKTIGNYKAKQCNACKAIYVEGDVLFNMVCIPATQRVRRNITDAFEAKGQF